MAQPSFRQSVLGLAAAFAAGGILLLPAVVHADTTGSAPTAADLSAGDTAVASAEPAPRIGKATLRPGASGPAVRALQILLAKAGFQTKADGHYGAGTATTVRRFQRAARLRRTGVADPRTIRQLQLAASGAIRVNSSGGYDATGGVPNRHLGDRIPLREGMSGHDVKILQDFLRRAGFKTSVDGEFGSGTVRTVQQFERDQQQDADGVVDAADIDLLRSLVEGDDGEAPATPTTPAPLGPGQTATVGDDGLAIAPEAAPDAVKQIIAAGNAIAKKPYRYGGGHGRWNDTAYDCSGSVSYALHGAGLLDSQLTSGDLAHWGESGPGQWVTIYANGGHVYMMVAGLRFDTSGRQQDGTRWHTDKRSGGGYTVVHPSGL